MIRLIAAGCSTVVVGLAVLGAGSAVALDSLHTGFVRPLDHSRISQGFGCTSFVNEQIDRACPGGHFHSGIDLAAPLGTPVHATLAGRAHVLRSSGGYGLHIVIDHGGGLQSLYGHLSAVCVTDGELVAAGDVVGAVGSSGNSTGPHLHFEIRRNGEPEDPQEDLRLP